MTALTEERKSTAEKKDGLRRFDMAVAKAFKGGLTVLDASGNAKPGETATGLTAVGRAEETVDNSGGAAGDKKIDVKAGIFPWANSGADPIDKSHIEGTAYIVDDQTVAATDGTSTRSAAGRIVDVDDDGVWVATGTP